MIIGILGSGIIGYLWTLIPIDQVIPIVVLGFVLAAWTNYWGLIASSVYLPEPFPTQIRVRGAGIGNAIGRVGRCPLTVLDCGAFGFRPLGQLECTW